MSHQHERRITIKDLAKELNLSASTISRSLANHPGISDSTKKLYRKQRRN